VATVAAAPDAPQRGDKKICELLSSRCFSCVFVVMLIFSEALYSG
jgi:hypothetical protein